MKNDDGFLEEGEELEDSLLEFEFDDLSEEDLDRTGNESASEDTIIALVDVVEEGDALKDPESDEIAMSLEGDEIIEQEIGEEEPDLAQGLDSAFDASPEELESTEEPALDFEFEESDLESLTDAQSEEETPLDLEDLGELEEFEAGPEVEVDEFGPELSTSELEKEPDEIAMSLEGDEIIEQEIGEDFETSEEEDLEMDVQGSDLESVIEEEPDEESAAEDPDTSTEELPLSELRDQTDAEVSPAEAVSIGISEERIAAIIREAVEDVVERVARETMVSVAERLIGEAIDALKQTLESPPEQ
ncbi:MAG: hypothetical protein JRJ15_02490 [Deltaproteobacteria bacterium]|nr:hypothetical protein [Deltaproteobacteria bacterium]